MKDSDLKPGQDLSAFDEKRFAGRGESNAPAVTSEKRETEISFEVDDKSAQR